MLNIQQLTYRVRVSLEAPKFYYEIGHYDAQGVFYEHVVSGFLFDTYGQAEAEAISTMLRVHNAMALRVKRQQAAYAYRCAGGGNGGSAA